MPSTCSLLSVQHRVFDGAAWSPEAIGCREALQWQGALTRSIDVTKRHRARVLDVMEDELRDPVTLVERVYGFLGLSLTADLTRAITAWWRDNPKDKHGVHTYRAEDFGLSSAGLRELFATYRDQFGFDRPTPEGT